MLRIKSALATGLVLGLTSLAASAGELSYESRGYGGPLYVGPNFQQGGQHAPPVYGPGSESSHSYHSTYREEREERASRHVAKKKTTHETGSEKSAPEKSTPADTKPAVTKAAETTETDKPKTAEAENSSITTAATAHTAEALEAPASKPVTAPQPVAATENGCRRFVAAVGAIIAVPCD